MSKSQVKARPVREVRLGRIRAAIWENESAADGLFVNHVASETVGSLVRRI